MPDLYDTYQLSRGRFDDAVAPLSAAQLNHRLYEGSLTIGEMALHLAGVEVWFVSQLTGDPLDAFESKLARCATEGVVDEAQFPFTPAEITPEVVANGLAVGRARAERLLAENRDDLRAKQIKSALGPVITGAGALQRFAFHPGYHHGQAFQIVSAPGFPAG